MEEVDRKIDGRWIELKVDGQKISRRSNHSAAMVNGCLYVYGGYDIEDGILSDLNMIDLSQNNCQWKEVKIRGNTRPGPRRNHTLRAYNNVLFLFGGQANALLSTNKLHRYHVLENRWEAPQKLAIPAIDSHEAIIYDNSMYIYGGYFLEKAQFNPNMYQYEIASRKCRMFQVCSKIPVARSNLSMALVENSFYIFGGCNIRNLNDLWKFDLAKAQWQEIKKKPGSMWPQSRKGHTCCHYEGYLFIFGGMQGLTNEKNEMLVFDLKNESWQEATTNTNELIKMYQRSLKTQITTPIEIRKTSRRSRPFSTRCCKFNITTTSFRNSERPSIFQFAETSLYRRRGQKQLFSSMKSKHTVVQENKRKSFKLRKQALLRQFQGSMGERRLSPTTEAMRYAISTTVHQHRQEHEDWRMTKVSTVKFDEKRRFLIGKLPCARDGHSSVVYNNYMVIFGGDRHMMSFQDIFLFRLDKAVTHL